MGRHAEGWTIRRDGARGTWRVRFRHLGRRIELSTGLRDESEALVRAKRLYEERTGNVIGYIEPKRTWPHHRGVYAVQGAGGYIKIGWANNVNRRLRALQTGHPEVLRLLAVLDGGRELERALHVRLGMHRALGEWFRPTPEVLRAVLQIMPCETATPCCDEQPRKVRAA